MADADRSVSSKLIGAAGSIVGIALGGYCGIDFLIPAAAAGLIFLAISRTRLKGDRAFTLAVCALGGQLLWMTMGIYLTSNAPSVVVVEVILDAGLLIVFVGLRSSKFALVPLLLYQVLADGMNVMALVAAEIGSLESRALLSHVTFRSAGIGALVWMLIRKKTAVPETAP